MKMNRSYNTFTSLSLIALSLASAIVSSALAAEPARRTPHSWPGTRASQLVFFAVLEGLYRDGVTNSDVDLIIPPSTNGAPRFDPEHFVYACPLCHPAFEAFRLYRHRDRIFGLKAPMDTFGPGLDDNIRSQLRSPNPESRRKAIETLISRWVAQRLELMRLTPEERADITREMEQGRKQGMGALKNGLTGLQLRKNCPICDGSFGACKLK
ncbi:MAG: hypothetical protein C5B50_25320 [Verrucomicrobia bacterium]|nr:MAG: hypothetical protein C5B50_25320 [Verrucomicrobiota bacterium]